MLTDLIGWLGKRGDNRRQHHRVAKAYKAAYSIDGTTWQPAIGVDLSDEGMCILVQADFGDKPINVRATLDTRLVNMRCVPVWHNKVNHNGKPVECYGLKFIGIGADDWDSVVRWIATGSAEDPNKSQQDMANVRMKDDDVARLIPKAFLDRLLGELVKRHRLAPLDGKSTPLVQLDYNGCSPWRGRNMHRLTIHSKIEDGKSAQRFSTRFMFDDSGKEIIVLN